MAKNKTREVTNVEFGQEFGDVNAAKQMEIPFLVPKSEKKSNKRNK